MSTSSGRIKDVFFWGGGSKELFSRILPSDLIGWNWIISYPIMGKGTEIPVVGLALSLELDIGIHFLVGWKAKTKQSVVREEESGEMNTG